MIPRILVSTAQMLFLAGLISSFPLSRRAVCPRQSNPSSTCVMTVFAGDSARPRSEEHAAWWRDASADVHEVAFQHVEVVNRESRSAHGARVRLVGDSHRAAGHSGEVTRQPLQARAAAAEDQPGALCVRAQTRGGLIQDLDECLVKRTKMVGNQRGQLM